MAKFSVSEIPAAFSASSNFQRVAFSVWSGLAGIAGGRPDAAVILVDQVLGFGRLFRLVPPFPAHAQVEKLGKGLGQSVGQGFGHDGAVVVVSALEALDQFLQTVTRGDGKGAKGNRVGLHPCLRHWAR